MIDFDQQGATAILAAAAAGADDGELFAENSRRESFRWSDGRLIAASYGEQAGFGIRVVSGESVGYAYADGFDCSAMRRAAATAAMARRGQSGSLDWSPPRTNFRPYADLNPVEQFSFSGKIDALDKLDAYLRARDPQVVQVSGFLTGERREICILRPNGDRYEDDRPQVQITIGVTVERNGRRESATSSAGGRIGYDGLLEDRRWQGIADEALRIALIKLQSVPGPAGEMDVVIGPGWPGMMLHEAVGHGLEGDFIRKGISVYAGRIGERVAAPGVTIIDDGTLGDRRGSLTFDDEGTPTAPTVLVENGILKSYLHDRMSARLTGGALTGNGRRQSYTHIPMPRMTNTFMAAGSEDPRAILAGLKRGIYARQLGGGQVDITSGKFVFQCEEAYAIEDGRIVAPIKGATLIGDGPRTLMGIRAIGNDLALDPGQGICGKEGQQLPVGVGMPTVHVAGMTVGSAG